MSGSGHRGRPAVDIEELLDTAERQYVLDGTTEYRFAVRKRPGVEDYYKILESELQKLDGVTVTEYRTVKEGWARLSRPATLSMGVQTLVAKRPRVVPLREEVTRWRSEFADLTVERALQMSYDELIANPQTTRSCLEVLSYLIANRIEIVGLLPRQIQHSNSTKLIGRESLLLRLFTNWRGETAAWSDFYRYFELAEKPLEFRFYAPRCVCQGALLSKFNGLIALDWASTLRFDGLKGTLIVENFETFLAEAARSEDHLIIWGSGWKASGLRHLHSLFPRPLLYWGDMDKEGYEIYGHLCGVIPELRSTLMSRAVIDRYEKIAVKKEPFFGPFRTAADVQAEYQYVSTSGLCIEQEKIHERPY